MDWEMEKGCIRGGLWREVEKATRCKHSSGPSTLHPSAAGSKHSNFLQPVPKPRSHAMQGEEAWVESRSWGHRSKLISAQTLTLCRGHTHLYPFSYTMLLLPGRTAILLLAALWGKKFGVPGLTSDMFRDPAKAPQPPCVFSKLGWAPGIAEEPRF